MVFLGCPLVTLEHGLRGHPAYFGSFTCWLLYRVFGITVPPWLVTAGLVSIAAGVVVSEFASLK